MSLLFSTIILLSLFVLMIYGEQKPVEQRWALAEASSDLKLLAPSVIMAA